MKNENKELEEAVICCMLLDENVLVKIRPKLGKEMFFTPELAFIYEAIAILYDRGEQPDLVTTEAEMRRLDANRCREMNGIAYVKGLLNRVRHTGNVEHYVKEIRQHYLRHRLAGLFSLLSGKANQPETDGSLLIGEAEKSLLELREWFCSDSELCLIGDTAEEILHHHLERKNGVSSQWQVMTGLDEFDALTGGLHAGEVCILAGRTGEGKSAVALQIALNAAMAGKKTCFFSMEMTKLQNMNRYFTGYTTVQANHLRTSQLTEAEILQLEELARRWKKLPFWLDYNASKYMDDIRAQVMLQKRKDECDLVIIDYLHMLEMRKEKSETLDQAIARTVRAIKRLANEASVPILVVSQMNRNIEKRTEKAGIPVISDLRDSGTIEQIADCITFLYRPDRNDVTEDTATGESLEGVALLMVLKNRNGALGAARLRFNSTFTRLWSYNEPSLFPEEK